MSIASEITRLQGVKSDILQAIADKGVTVPAGSALDDCPALIASIPTGIPAVPEGYTKTLYTEISGLSRVRVSFASLGDVATYLDTLEMSLSFPDFTASQYAEGGKYAQFKLMGNLQNTFPAGRCFFTVEFQDDYYGEYRTRFRVMGPYRGFDTTIEFSDTTQPRYGFPQDVIFKYITNGSALLNTTSITGSSGGDSNSAYHFDSNNMFLNCNYSNQSNEMEHYKVFAGTKIYGVRIKSHSTGAIIADFVPAKRNSDGAAGFVELIKGKFDCSIDVNALLAGPEAI